MASIHHRGHLALLPLLLLFVSLPGFVAPAPINRKQVALRSEQVARQGLVHMIVFVKELHTQKTTTCLTNMPHALLTWSSLSNSCMHKNQLLVWQICHMPCSHDCQTDAHTKWFSLSQRCTHKNQPLVWQMHYMLCSHDCVKQLHTQQPTTCLTDTNRHLVHLIVTQLHTQPTTCLTDTNRHLVHLIVTQLHTQPTTCLTDTNRHLVHLIVTQLHTQQPTTCLTDTNRHLVHLIVTQLHTQQPTTCLTDTNRHLVHLTVTQLHTQQPTTCLTNVPHWLKSNACRHRSDHRHWQVWPQALTGLATTKSKDWTGLTTCTGRSGNPQRVYRQIWQPTQMFFFNDQTMHGPDRDTDKTDKQFHQN